MVLHELDDLWIAGLAHGEDLAVLSLRILEARSEKELDLATRLHVYVPTARLSHLLGEKIQASMEFKVTCAHATDVAATLDGSMKHS